MSHEVAVDDGVGAFVVGVGFFAADVEGVVVDWAAESEGDDSTVDEDGCASGLKFVPVLEDAAHGVLLVVGIEAGVHVGVFGSPFFFELPALFGQVGGELAVLVVGIFALKAVGVIALGLELFAREGFQGGPVVDVVGEGAVGCGLEFAGEHALQTSQHALASAHHQKRLPLGFGFSDKVEQDGGVFLAHGFFDIGRWSEWWEIGGLSIEEETDDEHPAVLGYLGVVEKSPRHEVHEVEVAVATFGQERILLHEVAVGIVNVSKEYHRKHGEIKTTR